MSKVYVCAGSCHGESDQSGNCAAAACERYAQPLQAMERCAACGVKYPESEAHQCSR
ncbi:MAG: hypothetical protein HYV33_01970 [Candidatus Kerfeldbacteria bacterium]|nr:hypothetical protein [Candidatus Kerfeldbacteria bacterium]